MNDLLDDLTSVVQYRLKKGAPDTICSGRFCLSGKVWTTIAAFNIIPAAEEYAEKRRRINSPWEYRVVNAPMINEVVT
jgi:hypothetical protein